MDKILPKRLPDDVVEYYIYHKHIEDEDCTLDTLERSLYECLAIVANETYGYIWQNQPFNLSLLKENGIPCLHGSTNFQDSVEDEWFIVYLLHKITLVCSDLIANVFDNDGHFLLIESADFLPKWLTPDSSDNRVFICNGMLHIIMKPKSPAEIAYIPAGPLTLFQAIKTVSQYPWITQASSAIIAHVNKRIASYPEKAVENIHYVNIYVNKKIVYLLDKYPTLISACVQAFYLRDPIDLKVCRQFKYFPPSERVWTQIAMTRCQYAQLLQQQFTPYKCSGYKLNKQLSPAIKKGYELGMKIAHGFEILCSKATKVSLNHSSGDSEIYDNVRFQKFVVALGKQGYFQNEVEGSKLHQKLMKEAEAYFVQCSSKGNCFWNEESCQVLNFLEIANVEQLSLESLSVYDGESLPKESSDKWMYLSENDVDDLVKEMNQGFEKLSQTGHHNHHTEMNDAGMEETLKLSASRVHEFVDAISSVDGIEVKSSDPVAFNCDHFLHSLNSMLGSPNSFVAKGESDSESDEFLDSDDECESDEDDSPEKLSCDTKAMFDYMQEMDSELAETPVGKSFMPPCQTSESAADDEHNTDTNLSTSSDEKTTENIDPVNVDFNLVENFLQSAQHEAGQSGPVSNVLRSVGINLQNLSLVK